MLRQIVRSAGFSPLRHSELKHYLCLREALNPALSKSLAEQFQALKTKTKLDNKQLISLIGFLKVDFSLIPKYFPPEQRSLITDELSVYLNSGLLSPNIPLETQQSTLKLAYPEAVAYGQLNSEQRKALEEIESFVLETSTTNLETISSDSTVKIAKHAVTNLKILGKRLERELQGDQEIREQIKNVLEDLALKMKVDGEYEVRRMAMFLDGALHRGELEETEKRIMIEDKERHASLVEKNVNNELPEHVRKEIEEVETIEFGKFLERERLSNQSEVGQWINGRKLVFNFDTNSQKTSPLWLIVLVGSGVSVLFFLYQGDAKFSTYALTGAALGLSFATLNKAGYKSSARVVNRIWLQKDGKSVDIELSCGKILQSAIKDLKIHKSDKTPVNTKALFGSEIPKISTLGQLRMNNYVPSSYYMVSGETEALLPLKADQDYGSFKKLIEGKEVAI